MKFLALLALVAVVAATIPTDVMYDNMYVEVDIPKGTFHGWSVSIPSQGYQTGFYMMLNVSLGVVTTAGHYASVYTSDDSSNPTKNLAGYFTYGAQAYAVVDYPFLYNCPSGVCTLYIYINATCVWTSGCFTDVTTDLSATGVVYQSTWYQPMYHPVTGYGYVGYPSLVPGYTTIQYPVTKAWQFFETSPVVTTNTTSPVTIYPSALAIADAFTVYGCYGIYPANQTNYCSSWGGWMQGRGGKELIVPGTEYAVAAIDYSRLYDGMYRIGLTNSAATLAASSLLLVLLALLF